MTSRTTYSANRACRCLSLAFFPSRGGWRRTEFRSCGECSARSARFDIRAPSYSLPRGFSCRAGAPDRLLSGRGASGTIKLFERSAKKNEEAFILLISERILRYNTADVSLQDLLAPLGWRFGSCLLSRVCRGGERLHDLVDWVEK